MMSWLMDQHIFIRIQLLNYLAVKTNRSFVILSPGHFWSNVHQHFSRGTQRDDSEWKHKNWVEIISTIFMHSINGKVSSSGELNDVHLPRQTVNLNVYRVKINLIN